MFPKINLQFRNLVLYDRQAANTRKMRWGYNRKKYLPVDKESQEWNGAGGLEDKFGYKMCGKVSLTGLYQI